MDAHLTAFLWVQSNTPAAPAAAARELEAASAGVRRSAISQIPYAEDGMICCNTQRSDNYIFLPDGSMGNRCDIFNNWGCPWDTSDVGCYCGCRPGYYCTKPLALCGCGNAGGCGECAPCPSGTASRNTWWCHGRTDGICGCNDHCFEDYVRDGQHCWYCGDDDSLYRADRGPPEICATVTNTSAPTTIVTKTSSATSSTTSPQQTTSTDLNTTTPTGSTTQTPLTTPMPTTPPSRSKDWGKPEYDHCVQAHSWKELIQGNKTGAVTFKMGGLGLLMEADGYETWQCIRDHYCATDTQNPWFCFVYHETDKVFTPWGHNSQLKLA
jgi:hypothetical protein